MSVRMIHVCRARGRSRTAQCRTPEADTQHPLRQIGTDKQAAVDKWVSLLGGSISRQCLELGLDKKIQLHVVPILLGDEISLFAELSKRIKLKRVETSAFANSQT